MFIYIYDVETDKMREKEEVYRKKGNRQHECRGEGEELFVREEVQPEGRSDGAHKNKV